MTGPTAHCGGPDAGPRRADTSGMFVRDVMTSQPFTIRRDKRMRAVQDLMEWGRFRHVPVVDEHGFLAGIVSRTDLLAVSASVLDPTTPRAQREFLLAGVPIERVMRTDVVQVEPDCPVALAARHMREFGVSCLPVVEGGRLVGIVTAFDLLGVLADARVG